LFFATFYSARFHTSCFIGRAFSFLLLLCSARLRASHFISLCLCLLLPWERSFLSKGTVFLLKPQLLLWFCTNSNGHPCKQACRCLLLYSARFRTLCSISLWLCLLFSFKRRFLLKGTLFLLKPKLTLWFLPNSNGHPCKQACRCLLLFGRKSFGC
jgi:hypothetical protein